MRVTVGTLTSAACASSPTPSGPPAASSAASRRNCESDRPVPSSSDSRVRERLAACTNASTASEKAVNSGESTVGAVACGEEVTNNYLAS